MTIKHMAREEVVSVEPDTKLTDVATTLERERVGSVVVTSNGEPVGIVTDRDLALHVVTENRDAASITAEDVMTSNLFTVDADELIYDVLEQMREAGVRRVPVVEDGELTGIVTLDDFLVLLSSELDHMSAVIQSGAPEY